jgi:hypothetical protein
VAGQLQYGILTGDGDLNAYNLGLGLLGGDTLDPRVYVGGRFEYFLGEAENAVIRGVSAEARAKVGQLMGEVGYDLGLTPALVQAHALRAATP